MSKISIGVARVLSLAALLGCARDDRSLRAPSVSVPPASGPPSASPHSPTSRASLSLPAPFPSAAPAIGTVPLAADPSLAFSPPATLHFPSKLAANERLPLLVVLHGYGVPSALLMAKARLSQLADEKRFAFVVPDGNRDSAGRPFWNVGPSCCSIDASKVDDVGRLSALVQSTARNPAIDPTRVYLIGYSNGGFMAHRLACAIGEHLAAVISISGAASAAGQPCEQKGPLAMVEIHGEADPIVRYGGGRVFDRTDFAEHPSSMASMEGWAERLGCSGKGQRLENRDLEPAIKGAETQILRFEGCRGAVELWTVKGGAHYIALEAAAFEAIWTFLRSHPRQAP